MIGLRDLLVVVVLSGGTSAAVAAAGKALLRRLRHRSIGLSVALVASVPLVSVLAGALVAATSMFLSRHDLTVLGVIVIVAGAVGVSTVLLLGRQVARGSQLLGSATSGLADGTYRSPGIPLNADLAALDRQLSQLSRHLQVARRREHDLEASRRNLVAWVSHDLRTPLAGIRAMSEALEDGVIDDADTITATTPGSAARWTACPPWSTTCSSWPGSTPTRWTWTSTRCRSATC